MIIGTSITQGYQQTITQKFYSCWGQVHIIPNTQTPDNLIHSELIYHDKLFTNQIQHQFPDISITPFTIQTAIIKHQSDIDGIILKAYDSCLPPAMRINIPLTHDDLSVKSISDTHYVYLSSTTASQMQLKIGDKFQLVFLDNLNFSPRTRRVFVKGIFNTGLEDFDKQFAICSKELLNSIQEHDADFVSGYELFTSSNTDNKMIVQALNQSNMTSELKAFTVKERLASVFAWIDMMKMNERIIIIIMMFIAVVNMISSILILILERTHMIGLLKSLGMPNTSIRSVFWYNSLLITLVGMLIGNAVGIGLCYWQAQTGLVKLDESVYYISQIPIYINPLAILKINGITLLICLSLLLIPTWIINSVSPIKALRFD